MQETKPSSQNWQAKADQLKELRVLLMGLPGSGKSTLIDNVQHLTSLNYISLGEITRKELQTDSDLANQLRSLFQTSDPWPSEFVFSIVEPYLLPASGLVLDGIPRKANEAEVLFKWAKQNNFRFDVALSLNIDREVGLERIVVREDAMRLEQQEHYQTRMDLYVREKPEIDRLVRQISNKEITIDTTALSPREVVDEFFALS